MLTDSQPSSQYPATASHSHGNTNSRHLVGVIRMMNVKLIKFWSRVTQSRIARSLQIPRKLLKDVLQKNKRVNQERKYGFQEIRGPNAKRGNRYCWDDGKRELQDVSYAECLKRSKFKSQASWKKRFTQLSDVNLLNVSERYFSALTQSLSLSPRKKKGNEILRQLFKTPGKNKKVSKKENLKFNHENCIVRQ